MALDFPNSPTNGQTFTANGNIWTYDGSKWNATNLDTKANLSGASFTGAVVSAGGVTGTTPPNAGSSGGLVSRAPASGTQLDAYLQFVNNANTIQWGAIAANSSNALTYLASSHNFDNLIVGKTNTGGTLVNSNDSGSLSVRGNATNAASISFHRPGIYAINMGLDTDNGFKIGGWSQGSTPYLQIDTSGRVATPYKPAMFLDGNDAGWYALGGQTIKKLSVRASRGGLTWDASTGRVTVPVSGWYAVSQTGYYAAGSTQRRYIRLNGGTVCMLHRYEYYDSQNTIYGIFYANANDYFDVYQDSAVNQYYGSVHTYITVEFLG